jgi:hypothetical protein
MTLLAAGLLSSTAAWCGPATFDASAMAPPQSRGIGAQQPGKSGAKPAAHWARFYLWIKSDKPTYKVGDLMDFTIKANKSCYVMVYCVGTDGKTTVICPSAFSPKNHLTGGVAFKLRDSKGRKLEQFGPGGAETVQVVATERPLNVKQLLAKVTAPKPLKSEGSAAPEVTPAENNEATAETDNASLGTPTAPPVVADPQPFVNETEALIRGFVREKSRSIGAARPNATPTPDTDGVYGLATVKYKVVGK